MNKGILVVGGSGVTGSAVVRALLADPDDDWTVRVLTRDTNSERARTLAAQNAERVILAQGNLDDAASVRAAMAGVHRGVLQHRYFLFGERPHRIR